MAKGERFTVTHVPAEIGGTAFSAGSSEAVPTRGRVVSPDRVTNAPPSRGAVRSADVPTTRPTLSETPEQAVERTTERRQAAEERLRLALDRKERLRREHAEASDEVASASHALAVAKAGEAGARSRLGLDTEATEHNDTDGKKNNKL